VKVQIPLRTGRGLNGREHHFTRARRVKAERNAVAWFLNGKTRPALPVVVTMTRISPGTRPMDDDQIPGALKACRDQVAQWLGVDDADSRVTWRYAQRRGPWGVEVEFS
jgi:hypothetical protein